MSEIEANSIRLPVQAIVIYVVLVFVIRGLLGGSPESVGAADDPLPVKTIRPMAVVDSFGVLLASDARPGSRPARHLLVGALDEDDATKTLIGFLDPLQTSKEFDFTRLDGSATGRTPCPCHLVGDLDGDDVPEFATALGGGLTVRRGADRSILFEVPSTGRDDWFGATLITLGDIDGDRVHDLAIGAPGDTRNGSVGRVAFVSGRSGEVIEIVRAGNRRGDRFGAALAAIGDLDDDGIDDLLVGAPGAGHNGYHSGAVWLVSGRSKRLTLIQDGSGDGAGLGRRLIALPDIDGDGHRDYATVETTRDDARLELRSGKTAARIHRSRSYPRDHAFGESLIAAGDIDGDGICDVAVGAPHAPREKSGKIYEDVGAVIVFSGRDGEVLHRFAGDEEGGRFGHSLAPAGDLDGDGRDEILISSPGVDGGLGRIDRFELPN